jgi:uncharacterized protein YoxC
VRAKERIVLPCKVWYGKSNYGMFSTSKDILYIVLAVSVALVTVFFVWCLWYIALMLKKAHALFAQVQDLLRGIHERIEQLERLFKTIEEKVSASASYLPLVFKGVSEIVEYFKKRKANKKSKRE